MKARSLRVRLIVIILTPLIIISAIAAVWQFQNARHRAEDIFDRGLLSAALAISRDVAISGGDALSPATRALINDTSGGELFYHVYAPDGVFVTGYSTPPRPPGTSAQGLSDPQYYVAQYQGREMRVLQYRDATTIDDVSGLFTISVWQEMAVRNAFVRDVAIRSISVLALILTSVACVVWFGVGYGLRPLLDLEDAIARRNVSELQPIRRSVPAETEGIVSTLNALLERVSRRISSKDEFISNAAHQLRNPIAGVLALAEAVENAPNPNSAKTRSAELVKAARDAAHLTNQLLSFERAAGSDVANTMERLDFSTVVNSAVDRFFKLNPSKGEVVQINALTRECMINGDKVMLQEALLNLLTNSIVHGGANMTEIRLSLETQGNEAILTYQDNGLGIPKEARVLAMGRFSQAQAGPGTGLGLPIAARVFETHGGSFAIEESSNGARFKMTLPVA